MEEPNLPHANDSEKFILAICLIEGKDGVKRISHLVDHKDFYDTRHAVIYRAIEYLYKNQKDINLVSVHEFLQLKGYSDQIGGASYLAELTMDLPPASHVPTHAKTIRDRAVLRNIIKVSTEIARRAHTEDDLDKFLMDAESSIKNVTRAAVSSEGKHSMVDLDDWRQIARDTQPSPGTVRGISSGYKALDDITEGFEGGEMYILTGHTGQGKSQLATNWAINVAQTGKTVLFINTEMTKLQMGRRVNNILGDDKISGRIILNDRSDIDHRDVVAIMENAKEAGCDFVVVDHLHYFARSEDNATGQVSKMTKEFKDAAVNLDIPLLLLCHVDQSKPATMRPTLKMLKNSSSIAQDSDMVLTIFRNEEENPGVLEIIRLKGRSTAGRISRGQVYYDGLKLTEVQPISAAESVRYVDHQSRMLGERDAEDLSVPNWASGGTAGPVIPIN